MPLIAIGHVRASSVTTRVVDDNWSDVWTADHGDRVNAVRFDADGNLFTGGQLGDDNTIHGLRKYTSSGVQLWSIDTTTAVNGITLYGDSAIISCHNRRSDSLSLFKVIRRIAQSTGAQIWETTYGTNNQGRNAIIVPWPAWPDPYNTVTQGLADDPSESTATGYDFYIYNYSNGVQDTDHPTWFYGCEDLAHIPGTTAHYFVCGRRRNSKALKRVSHTSRWNSLTDVWARDTGPDTGGRTSSTDNGARLYKLDIDSDNNVYTVGEPTTDDVCCWAYDADGNLRWTHAHGGTLYTLRYYNGLVYIGGNISSIDGASVRVLDASDGTVLSSYAPGVFVRAIDIYQPAAVTTHPPGAAMRLKAAIQAASRSITMPGAALWLAHGPAIGYGIPSPPIPPGHPDTMGDGPALPVDGWPLLTREPYPGGYLFGFPGESLPTGWPGSRLSAHPARLVFRLYWSSTAFPGPLELPLAGFQCRRRFGASTWLTVDVPTCAEPIVSALTSGINPEIRIYGGHAIQSEETLGEMLMGIVTDVDRTEQGGRGGIRIRARVQTPSYSAATRTLWAVTRRGDDDGRRWADCAVDPSLRPNDTVRDADESWVAGTIAYRVTPSQAIMRVIERL